MSATSTEVRAPGTHPDLPPPPTEVGLRGWMYHNLFSSWPNSILTIASGALLVWILANILPWLFFDAYWSGNDRSDCPAAGEREGACWVYIKVWFKQLMYGRYPREELWRINSAYILLVGALIPLIIPALPERLRTAPDNQRQENEMTAANPFAAKARTAPAAERSAEDFMDGGASVALKFPKEGFEFEGDVIAWSPAPFQMTDKDTGELLFWEAKKKTPESKIKNASSKANPCMQITIDFQGEPTGVTWESNRYIRKEIPDDDGVRTAWLPGGSELMKAITKARAEAAQKYKLGRPKAPLEAGAHVRIKRGPDKKFPNDYFGFSFVAQWTPAANNPAWTEKMLDSVDESDPWATESDTPAAAAQEEEPPF
jgi:hypothetical protein